MKKVAVVSIVLVVTMLAIGCGSTAPAAAPAAADPNSPEWLNDFPPEDALWGIGTAKQSSDSMSMTTAEARARVAIARQLNTKVEAMFTDYNRDAGTAGSQANVSLQEDVSRQITSMQLNGARPIKRWKAPDGTWWYLVEFKKADAAAAVSQVFDSEAARYAEFKKDDALRMLDAQLSKGEKPITVND
jgi:hypothetical protein